MARRRALLGEAYCIFATLCAALIATSNVQALQIHGAAKGLTGEGAFAVRRGLRGAKPKAPAPRPVPNNRKYEPGGVSRMWGNNGERFDYTGRMSDWSWAGYRMNERPIPDPPATLNLKTNFGAIGDGTANDTDAFIDAFLKAPPGAVLYIPPGRYVLGRAITRTKPIVIRGAGRDQTTIFLPNSLNDVNPWNPDEGEMSEYRDGPFFISLQGTMVMNANTFQGNVSRRAERGDKVVYLRAPSTTKLLPGQTLRFTATDRNLSLVTYMYGGMTGPDWGTKGRSALGLMNKRLLTCHSRIKSVARNELSEGVSLRVELVRPLPFDLRPDEWDNVEAHYVGNSMIESGIEDLTMEFAMKPYKGHLLEDGYNALILQGCVHCWARRLRVLNADNGINLVESVFSTMEDLEFGTTGDRTGGRLGLSNGHHHVMVPYIHDLTFDHQASLCVYHNVTSPDLSMDFHSSAPTMNLLSRMYCGMCRTPWASGGTGSVGGHSGMNTVVWGLQAISTDILIPPMWRGFGRNFTIIGSLLKSVPTYDNFFLEQIDPGQLEPYDLQAAMVAKRLAATT